MKRLASKFCLWGLMVLSTLFSYAQSTLIEGYVYESDNRGYLNLVEITISDGSIEYPVIFSNQDGSFRTMVPSNKTYKIKSKKDLFFENIQDIPASGDKTFVKIEMKRKPGYIFDMTVAKNRTNPNTAVDAIMDTDIEIFNNTTQKEEVAWMAHHEPHFKYTFEKGNHYTLLISKEGYVAKRVEVYVNVNGCILCVDGLGDLRPGVTENLTAGNDMGTLLANVALDSIDTDKTFTFKNIYYDYNKWDITTRASKELMKVSELMKQNPQLILELGSHTDSRGNDGYNLELSDKRARSAVDYIIKNGEIDAAKLSARGYGESKIINNCGNGSACTENEHSINRRTELKVLGILAKNKYTRKSLAEMKADERTEKLIKNLQNQEVYAAKDTAKRSGELGGYNGIKIELLISETELKSTHEIYRLYKPIYHEELANGKHAYYTGTFKSALDANDFITRMKIKSKYPKTRLIQFNEGLRQE